MRGCELEKFVRIVLYDLNGSLFTLCKDALRNCMYKQEVRKKYMYKDKAKEVCKDHIKRRNLFSIYLCL